MWDPVVYAVRMCIHVRTYDEYIASIYLHSVCYV